LVTIDFAPVPDQRTLNALTATGGGSGNSVTFSNGPASIGVENRLTFSGAGEVTVAVSLAGDVNHSQPMSFTFISKATATVTLSGRPGSQWKPAVLASRPIRPLERDIHLRRFRPSRR
jgi:hypothetical protein